MANNQYRQVDPMELVIRPGHNPRERFDIDELVESIRQNGVVTAIRAYLLKDGTLEVIDGERRTRASKQLRQEGIDLTVPVVVEKLQLNEAELLIQAIVANDSMPLTEMEEARAYKRLINYGKNQTEIGRLVGRSSAHISNRLQLLGAEPIVQAALDNGAVNVSEVMAALRGSREDGTPQEVVLQGVVAAKKAKKEKIVLSVEEQYASDKEKLVKIISEIQLDDLFQMLVEYSEDQALEFLIPVWESATVELNKNVVNM
jgi:ParB/RepB/Spo0J family partition protein